MKVFVTGGAGFIGSNLIDRLLKDGHHVVAYDNFVTGRHEFLEKAVQTSSFCLVSGDTLDSASLAQAMDGCEFVFHLAANADVRFGIQHPRKDVEQNTLATFNVLEAMRVNGIRRLAFSSTGSIYGEPQIFPTPENAPFPIQTSLYGASKLAGEGLIQAYCEGFNFQGYIFRFVSILGERYTHGHIFDFYKRLREDPAKLTVLGNGRQTKSYLYVADCIDAMLLAIEKAQDKVNIFNLGTDEYCQVIDSIRWITGYLNIQPELIFSGGERGWIGDSPFIHLNTSRIRALGWQPQLTIEQAAIRTLEYLMQNLWLFDHRDNH